MRRKDREVTDNEAILAIIEAADSCRLALVDDTGPVPVPYIVALNYGFEPAPGGLAMGGTFWFHCAKTGRKLDLLARKPQVCIQLDCDHEPVTGPVGCSWGMKYASVVANGTARLVTEPVEHRRGLDCLMAHYMRQWAGHLADGSQPLGPRGHPAAMADGHPGGQSGVPARSTTIAYEEKYLTMTAVIRVDVTELSAKRKA